MCVCTCCFLFHILPFLHTPSCTPSSALSCPPPPTPSHPHTRTRSPQIFYAFDELLLLKRGGETIFNGPLGPNASLLVQYFESTEGVPRFDTHAGPQAAGVTRSKSGSVGTGGGGGAGGAGGDGADDAADDTLEARNAADWMLEVTSVDAAAKLGVNFAEVFRESALARCGGGWVWWVWGLWWV